MVDVPVVNFSKGEFAPELYSRVDTSQYGTGAKRLRNCVILPTGGVTGRPGTRVIGELDDEDEARLFPFQYSIDQSYVLGFQQGLMRVMTGGGFIVETDLKITAATLADPCELEIAFHDYAVGDRLFITGLTGTPELNNREVVVTAIVDDDHFEINIDSTDFTALTDSTGEVRVGAPTPPDPPPVVDPPVPPPDPPPVGGGGGSNADGDAVIIGGVGGYP